jgi:hypothetical protein
MAIIAALCLCCIFWLHKESPSHSPESLAIDYLAREVPAWSKDNRCFSCHNNGDAARALFAAHRLSLSIPRRSLDDTLCWLGKPGDWDDDGGEKRYSGKALARVQFSSAMLEAMDAGLIENGDLVRKAADLVAQLQEKDGFWKVDAEGAVGSPVTYGRVLATVRAVGVLRRADPERQKKAIDRADGWLLAQKPSSVLDAAALLLALDDLRGDASIELRKKCLQLVRQGQSKDGGWGPFVNSASEPFDTALVLLALTRQAQTPDVRKLLEAGRDFLIANQEKDGSWKETTRPRGAESYAQRLSTTGWATLALLATRSK